MALDEKDREEIKKLLEDQLKPLGQQFVTPESAAKMVEQGIKKAVEGLDIGGQIKSALKDRETSPDQTAKKDGKVDPELAKLQADFESLKEKNRQAEEARKAAEDQARNQTTEQKIREALSAGGISPERQHQAMAYLKTLSVDGKPALRLNDKGEVIWEVARKGYTDQLPIQEGVKEWVKSDEAAIYLPPTGGRGTGATVGQTPNSTSATGLMKDGKLDPVALKNTLVSNLKNLNLQG